MPGAPILRSSPIRLFLNRLRVSMNNKDDSDIVDNGDNDGRIIPEYYDTGNSSLDATRCIESWLGNMRCDT